MERTTFERLIRQIWPLMQRAINDILSFVQRIIKAFIHIVAEEL
jgi:histone H3/H4